MMEPLVKSIIGMIALIGGSCFGLAIGVSMALVIYEFTQFTGDIINQEIILFVCSIIGLIVTIYTTRWIFKWAYNNNR